MPEMEEKYQSLCLKNQLCFPLYACAREVIRQYGPHLDALGLTYTQYIAMMVVWEEGCISAKEIGARLLLDSGTLTPVLRTLEKKGYLRRYRSPEDERVLLAEVTEEGLALRERALEVPMKMAQCARLTPEEAAELYRLLYKMMGSP